MLTAGVGTRFLKASSTFDSTKLHERPGIQSQAAAMNTDMDTSLRDRLVRTRMPTNVERGANNKRNVQWLLRSKVQTHFKHRCNFDSASLLSKIEQMLMLFAGALKSNVAYIF